MKRSILLLIVLHLIILLSACGPDFNTDFEPPPPNARLDDVFPPEINGMKSNIERIVLQHPLDGFKALYGDGKITIEAILAQTKENADSYFKDEIVPKFDKMKNHFRGSINGNWRADGTDENGRRWFAWANESWIFVLSGSDKDQLSDAIDAFKYVSK